MKIRPVILCGGAGTRLWSNQKNHQAKQFVNFGGWTLIQKTLERVKNPIFDYPIISTNRKYLKQVRFHLRKSKVKKYKIILEPAKKNTAPAMLASALIKDIPNDQPLMFFPADHLLEKTSIFNKAINKNKKNLNNKNIFIFGIKPTNPSSEYGYFLTKKINKNINNAIEGIVKIGYTINAGAINNVISKTGKIINENIVGTNYLEKLKLMYCDITVDIVSSVCTNITFIEFATYTNF